MLLNLCPHIIRICYDGKEVELLPNKKGIVARCSVRDSINHAHSEHLGFEVVDSPIYEDLTGVPTDQDDGKRGIVVSMVVGQYISKNPHLWKGPVYGPDTGSTAIRSEDGQVRAVTRFVVYKD